MKRLMAALLLVVFVTASSCSYYTCATYAKTEKKPSRGEVKI